MKRSFILLLLSFFSFVTIRAQDSDKMVNEGIELHDNKRYDEALKKYDSVISKDPGHYLAYYEKSYTLMTMERYEESREISRLLLKRFPENKENASVYVNYGTCEDMLKKPEKAIEIYNEGIRKFPNSSLLHFNKAITLYNSGKKEEARFAVQTAIRLKPDHASSHHLLSSLTTDNKIYSLLISLMFLVTEPTGNRAVFHIESVQKQIAGNVQKKDDDKSVVITLPAAEKGKNNKKENDFQQAEMMMSMSAALNLSDEYKDETTIDRIKRNLDAVFVSLSVGEKGTGFGWEFYVPFFLELKKQGYLETFCHVICVSLEDEDNLEWIQNNKTKLEAFFDWATKFLDQR